jgi:hypothetical protein
VIRWARDDAATLVIPAGAVASRRFTLRLKFESLIGQRGLSLRIGSDGKEGHRLRLGGLDGRVCEIAMPPHVVNGTCDIDLWFSGYDFCVPHELIGNGDTRRIGIGISLVGIDYSIRNAARS